MSKKAVLIGAATTLMIAGATMTTSKGGKKSRTTEPVTSPTPAPSPTPTSSTFVLPAGYVLKPARDFGVRCDGLTDDTAALQKALNEVGSYTALELPAGTCLYGATLHLHNKTNVIVVGAGPSSTILEAKNPAASSFIVSAGSNISLDGFQVSSPNSTTRIDDGNGRGIYVDRATNVSVNRITVQRVAGAGIVYYVVAGGKITNSTVLNSLADAFHVTGASRDIVVQSNSTSGAGDDCYASVGYGSEINSNIQFLDNSCADNRASGITFEGTTGGVAYRNKLVRTGVSGIRIASISAWNTGAVRDIDMRENTLEDVKTRTDVDHAAIMVFTDVASISGVSIQNSLVTSPRTYDGIRIVNYVPATASINNVSYSGAAHTSNGTLRKCASQGTIGLSGITLSGNTLNSSPC